jgi:hypothetical protein
MPGVLPWAPHFTFPRHSALSACGMRNRTPV